MKQSKLQKWRADSKLSVNEAGDLVGISGMQWSRYERGSNRADAPIVEKIIAATCGAISAQDMHETRLCWLHANKPDEFAKDSNVEAAE